MHRNNAAHRISIGGGKLVYELLERTVDDMTMYGLEIRCSLFADDDVVRVDDISTDSDFALELLNTLADHVVTPCVAKEIIEEYLTVYYTVS